MLGKRCVANDAAPNIGTDGPNVDDERFCYCKKNHSFSTQPNRKEPVHRCDPSVVSTDAQGHSAIFSSERSRRTAFVTTGTLSASYGG